MEVNWFKYVTLVFSFFFLQNLTLSQNILTQSNFSSTYNDEQIAQDIYSY